MKKVLHVLVSNKYSGAENVVCTIIDNFKNEYEMAYCSPKGEVEEVLRTKNIKYYGVDKLNQRNLKKVIDDFNPDIIHAHDYRASVIVAFTKFKGRIISHIHNNCPFAMKWNLKTILYNYSIKKYSNVVGVSNRVYEEAIFKHNLKNKYTTIYNYVDSQQILMKSLEYEYNKKYDVFFIGRLTEQKDPKKFIEIVKEIKKNMHDVTAVMIGEGELKDEIIKLINEYNLQTNIEMVGFIKNPFPIIKKCKIGIMPSKWEGFGLTAIESMILGKVVLNSGVGGLNEIFKNKTEFIKKDVKDYVDGINAIILDNKEYECDEIIKKYCDKDKWKIQLEEIYKV